MDQVERARSQAGTLGVRGDDLHALEPVTRDERGRHGRVRRVSVQAYDPAAG